MSLRNTLVSLVDDKSLSLADRLRLRVVTLPRIWNKTIKGVDMTIGDYLENLLIDEALACGIFHSRPQANTIDWQAIANFIKEILPVIIEFIRSLLLLL